jgi:hypothetical protein
MTISVLNERALLPGRAPSCVEGPRLVIVDAQPLMRDGIVARIEAGLPSSHLVYVGSSRHAALEVVMVTGSGSSIIGTRGQGPITELTAASAFARHRTRPKSTWVLLSAQECRESNDTGPNSGRIQISGNHRLQGASSPPNRCLMLPAENRDLARIAR